jgi:hypothetical protein
MKTIKKYRKYNFKGQSITKNNKATEKIKPIEKAELAQIQEVRRTLKR